MSHIFTYFLDKLVGLVGVGCVIMGPTPSSFLYAPGYRNCNWVGAEGAGWAGGSGGEQNGGEPNGGEWNHAKLIFF